MFLKRHLLRKDEPGDDGGGVATAPAAPAAPDPAPAAPVAAPAASAPAAPSPAPAPAPVADDKGIWPENWRETVSKDDAKRLQQLQRYASPEAALQALFAAQDRIRSGELKPALGKNASADEIKEWRAAHGIPDSPDKYDLKDIKLEGTDKGVVDAFLKAAHEANQTPEQVKATLNVWNQIKSQAMEARVEADRTAQQQAEDALRAEWGGEFRRNMNLIHGLLDGAGAQDVKAKFLAGRLADGTPIGSSPEVLKMLVGLALIQNPTGVVVPGGEANREGAVEDEISKIERVLRENRKAYDKDEKMQARYRDLLEAREKMKPRG